MSATDDPSEPNERDLENPERDPEEPEGDVDDLPRPAPVGLPG
jgi:hypothetical protein